MCFKYISELGNRAWNVLDSIVKIGKRAWNVLDGIVKIGNSGLNVHNDTLYYISMRFMFGKATLRRSGRKRKLIILSKYFER